ncbi:kinase-like domain-containing protein [Fomitopsis serialis]|uniref:kinase-like domain-containing protein n=1 Tax=Fomitopsis serialis TaxID=139415 RepID=UPI0020075C82|nr:kinase-like domain-containing protein [Neoantrodia serialis]KAH9934222.1 kinase-like domain-containing protein [Neoantrodia serialis]
MIGRIRRLYRHNRSDVDLYGLPRTPRSRREELCVTLTSIKTHCDELTKKGLFTKSTKAILHICEGLAIKYWDIFPWNGSYLHNSPLAPTVPDAANRWYEQINILFERWSSWTVVEALMRREVIWEGFREMYSKCPYREARNMVSSFPVCSLIEDATVAVHHVLSHKVHVEAVLSLNGPQAADWIYLLDHVMHRLSVTNQLYTTALFTLRKLCASAGKLPDSYMISAEERNGLKIMGKYPTAFGGFADIWRGQYRAQDVAVKALRVSGRDKLQAVEKMFFKEVVLWKNLRHDNITPFIGVDRKLFPCAMVSVWMPHGNIVAYLGKFPEAARLQLLLDVATGLEYLHSFGIVHGDLKGANILIDSEHRARLADFGLTAMTHDLHALNAITPLSIVGSLRWTAPEVLDPESAGLEKARPSKASDVYSLGLVMWEVFAGHVPFHQYPLEANVLYRVLAGARPARPNAARHGLSDSVWEWMQRCWDAEASRRPRIADVVSFLRDENVPLHHKEILSLLFE